MTPEPIVREIQNCARCGDNHPPLTFRAFQRPVDLGPVPALVRPVNPGPTLTHWASCPATGEPILLAHIEDAA